MNKNNSFSFVSIASFSLIFLSSGLCITANTFSSFTTISLWIVLLVSLIFFGHIKVREVHRLFISVFLCFLFLFLAFYHGDSIETASKNIFSYIVVICYVLAFSWTEIRDSLINVITFIAVVSLFFFFFLSLFPSLQQLFVFRVDSRYAYSNWVIYVHMLGLNRNCGMFWEPGVYQIFLNLALLLEVSKLKPRKKTILILVVTSITTFSTTGFLALGLLFLLVLSHRGFNKGRKFNFVLITLLFVFLVLYLFGDAIYETVFSKIAIFFEYKEYLNTRHSSASIRFFSIIKPFEQFLLHPLFGVGVQNAKDLTYSFLQGNLTCTFVNLLAFYGSLYGLSIIITYYVFSITLFQRSIDKLICFVFLFAITMSEDFSSNAFFYIIPFTIILNRLNVAVFRRRNEEYIAKSASIYGETS